MTNKIIISSPNPINEIRAHVCMVSSTAGVASWSCPGGSSCEYYSSGSTVSISTTLNMEVSALRISNGHIKVLVSLALRGSSPKSGIWVGEYGAVPYLLFDASDMCNLHLFVQVLLIFRH